ncbi:MAG: sugar phosphate isomerase/epimerase [Kiritimatiellae bacterium]|nr:sugar phosphate isomerase/epimerase [Kiritimatiellia bacterium]MDD2347432.1 sugar phosphate isomerase/epimerase [Kiritimatiellia bacterium]MDD3582671.1 sugar phosphate isomerase/epimerase [Kiritimatiellia bacterium]
MKSSKNLLVSVTAALFSVAASAQGVGTSATFKGPVGVQIYSLRNQLKQDGAKALDVLKDLNVKYVEIGIESHYGLTQEQMKQALDERGLIPIAAHAGQGFLLNKTDEAIAAARFFGLKYLGVAWASHKKPLDEAQTLKIAAEFNEIGKRLKAAGIQFFYHNHGFEFYPYKDGTLFDLLMEKTDPDLVKFEMDVLWTVFPGQDPVKLLKKYPDRWVLMHLKDLKKGVVGNLSGGTDLTNDVVLGTGQADYPAILKVCQEIGIKYYFIEDESPTVLEQLPKSLDYLSQIELR